MRFEEAFHGWTGGRLTQAEAAMLLGQCERSFRRHVERYKYDGLDGLLDKRLSQISKRRASTSEVDQVVQTYKSGFAGWNVAHFHNKYRSEFKGTRCASMRREGMRVSFHSDFMMAPPEPLTLAWCAANRITHTGRVVSPSERLTLMQALRGITIDAAWALRVEDEVGSIVAGKRADFCVLEDDPFELGVEQLHLVRVAGTVFEGELDLLPRAWPPPSPGRRNMHPRLSGLAQAVPC